ncbi:glycosyltransferase [Burkholderiales bacterium JOSHI_001]|nr:glycosyltransferase [Burkholderiales bacterium JOSHI_001]
MTHPSQQALDRPIGLLVRMFPKLSETFVLEEVLGLERLGVDLRIYTLAPPSDAVSHGAAARVRSPVVQVPERPWAAPLDFLACQLGWLAASPSRYLKAARQAASRGAAGWADFARAGWLARRCRRDGVGHLHTHFIAKPADVAELVQAVAGLPFSVSAHAKDIYLSDAADLRRKLQAARFTVTCTDFNCQTLRAIAPQAQVHRMYHGIDHGVFNPVRRASGSLVPLILSVGRLREKKGLDTLINACRLLQARGVPFRCEIVGYGEQHDSLAAQIAANGLQDEVVLAGKLTREHVIERYARAAVFVQPSRVAADGDRDGIPNVLLEAMAIGVPVVATRVSGIPELVQHRKSGLLVEPDEPAALADAIAQLIDDRAEGGALGAELARAARETVTQNFDNDRNLSLVMQLLAQGHQAAHAQGQTAPAAAATEAKLPPGRATRTLVTEP